MLQLYEGNLLIGHAPMEMSLNYCSHVCAYCFANIGHRDRKTALNSALNLIRECDQRETFIAWLLRNQYPVLLSNRVDPFALSNYRETIPIAAELTGRGIPIAWQTKGGKGIDDVLKFLPAPQVWYITLTTLDDATARRVEQAAPLPGERLALIEKLKAHGHRVVVGLNPLVPEWCPDPVKLMQEVQRRGAEGVWLEMLHLSKRQVKQMKPNEIKALGGIEALNHISHKRHVPEQLSFYMLAYQAAEELGLHPYGMSGFRPGKFTDIFHEVYPRCFPVLQDFANHLVATGGDGLQPVSFQQCADFFAPRFPQGRFFISDYIRSHITGRNFLADKLGLRLSGTMTFTDILRMMWNNPELPNCIGGEFGFAFMSTFDDAGTRQLIRDDAGDALYWFYPGMELFDLPVEAVEVMDN
jgi:DNA repair photolyase